MTRFVVGDDRSQSTLFPERLEDYLAEDNPVRAIDVFVDELDLAGLGFGGVEPEATGRPAYHPATLLKITSTDTIPLCNVLIEAGCPAHAADDLARHTCRTILPQHGIGQDDGSLSAPNHHPRLISKTGHVRSGTKRTFKSWLPMFALRGEADVSRACRNVCK